MRTRRDVQTADLYRNKDYEKLAREVIKTHADLEYIKTSDVAFVVLSSTKEKKRRDRKILGECQKVDDKYRWYIPFDFQIVIYDHNIADLDNDQLEILLWHEMKHIGIDEDGEETRYYVKEHDVEDFDDIIKAHGVHWEARE